MCSNRILWVIMLSFGLFVLTACGGDDDTSNSKSNSINTLSSSTNSPPDSTFIVTLPCLRGDENGDNLAENCKSETINIPDGRPIYALLVSGFHQNKNLDMFHFYNFAKCLQEKGAYVHYAWWNNLLAPYMEKPLHNDASEPSDKGNPWEEIHNYTPWPATPAKATPRDDFQFQEDAKALLTKIRKHNPDAAIILVGHSMGGDAVARLAVNPNLTDEKGKKIDIALLAPIDPVGNRSCLPPHPDNRWSLFTNRCTGYYNYTRYQATHTDWWVTPNQRVFGSNIKYLYHRWQLEYLPPFDYLTTYYFGHFDTQKTSIHDDSTNIQAYFENSILSGNLLSGTSWLSGTDVEQPPERWNWGGGVDGHGEIVGFRGAYPDFELDLSNLFSIESYPLALAAPDYWPSLQIERSFDNESDRANVRNLRISLLKEWETDSNYLDENLWSSQKPPRSYCDERGFEYDSDYCTYCMVSGDLCTILRTNVDIPDIQANAPPVANAGPDQTVECSAPIGTEVRLDGSGSSDPDGDSLDFSWVWPLGSVAEEMPYAHFPVGTHTITLTVNDGELSDTDTVDITVQDTIAPSLSISLSPNVLWPPNHKVVMITASIEVDDSCDVSPTVKLVSITSNEADNGLGDGDTSNDIQGAEFGTDDREFLLRAERSGKGSGRIYTVTYEVTDTTGNVTDATAEVTVLHDHGNQ